MIGTDARIRRTVRGGQGLQAARELLRAGDWDSAVCIALDHAIAALGGEQRRSVCALAGGMTAEDQEAAVADAIVALFAPVESGNREEDPERWAALKLLVARADGALARVACPRGPVAGLEDYLVFWEGRS